MKIGIVTVPDSANFGSFLQAFSLKLVVEEMGHEAVFLETREKEYIKKIYVNWKPRKNHLKHPIQFLRKNLNGSKKMQKFQIDQRRLEIRSQRDNEKFDLYLLGSDEIWNVRTEVFRRPIFYGKGMYPAVAYAVSAGNAGYEDFLKYPEIIENIKDIPDILVRDRNTRRIVERIKHIPPSVVCDPTLLVPAELLKEPYEDVFLQENPYLLIYLYPGSVSKEAVNSIRKLAHKEGWKLVSVGFWNGWCDYNVTCRPLEFSAILEGAEAVVTGTFHGTIFSILNRKRFISIGLTLKVRELLEQLGLSDRCIEKKDVSEKLLEKKIMTEAVDYNEIEQKIQELRANSLKLLKGVLHKYDY